MGVVLLNAGGVAGGLVLGRLIDRRPVFRTLALAFALGAAMVLALGASLGQGVGITLALTLATGLTAFGAQMNFPGLSANYYPVEMRSTSAGWTMALGRTGSVVGPLLGGALIGLDLGLGEVLYLAAVPAALTAVVLLAMGRTPQARREQR